MQKIEDLNQEIRKLSAFEPFKTDGQTLWLKEGLYEIKKERGKIACKKSRTLIKRSERYRKL